MLIASQGALAEWPELSAPTDLRHPQARRREEVCSGARLALLGPFAWVLRISTLIDTPVAAVGVRVGQVAGGREEDHGLGDFAEARGPPDGQPHDQEEPHEPGKMPTRLGWRKATGITPIHRTHGLRADQLSAPNLLAGTARLHPPPPAATGTANAAGEFGAIACSGTAGVARWFDA